MAFDSKQEKTKSAEQVEFYSLPSQIPELSGVGAKALDEVADRFAFRANDYYLGLVDWDDPDDPIGRLVIPHRGHGHRAARLAIRRATGSLRIFAVAGHLTHGRYPRPDGQYRIRVRILVGSWPISVRT